MPTVTLKNASGSQVGSVDLAEDVFGAPQNGVVVREVYNAYMANQRQGTHSCKTWARVSGSGRKPWRQKGTGRARIGAIRAPHWRGGAIIHGPQPRDYRQKVNRKKRQTAFRAVLSSRVADNNVILLDSLDMSSEPKTRRMAALLDAIGAEGRVLIVTREKDDMLLRAARNLPYAMVQVASALSIYDLLVADTLVMTRDAAEALQETLS